MKTEDLFKYGVTPKDGPYAGQQFKVRAITPTVVNAILYDGDKAMEKEFTHGSYDIWQEPKTLFEDSKIKPTWGNLKKAMEEAGLPDDTLFAVHDFIIGFRSAKMSVEKLRDVRDKEAIYVIVE